MMKGRDIEKILVNAPIKVNFAGLRGDTRSMQMDGWELNVEVDMSYQHHGYSVRLAGRHSGLQLMMYSGVAMLDLQMIHSNRSWLTWFEGMEFPISAQNIAQNIMMPASPSDSVARFAVDFTRPYLAEPNLDKIMSLEDIFFFQPMSDTSLYLPSEQILTVQEHLDKIVRGQEDKQKDIREKKRKMKSREGSQDLFNSNPAKEEIKLQLVAV